MRGMLTVLAALLLSFGHAKAQSCALTADQMSEVRGFKLGMTIQDVRLRHPNFPQQQADATGYAEATHHISYYMSYGEVSAINEADRKGLREIKTAFLDGKLVTFRISYDDSVQWGTVEAFLNAIHKPLKLPEPTLWRTIDHATKTVTCDGNTILVKLEFNPRGASLVFGQNHITEIRRKRAQEHLERQRRDFKP